MIKFGPDFLKIGQGRFPREVDSTHMEVTFKFIPDGVLKRSVKLSSRKEDNSKSRVSKTHPEHHMNINKARTSFQNSPTIGGLGGKSGNTYKNKKEMKIRKRRWICNAFYV